MKTGLLLLCVVCAAVSPAVSAEESWPWPDVKPAASMDPAAEFGGTNTTAVPPTTKPTTAAPPTTKPTTAAPPTTKPTTAAPPTTKPTTAKTTAAPTTAPPKNTTTPAPTTTTTPAPTTTTVTTTPVPSPTPATNLTVGNYTLKDAKGATCLLSHMAVQIRMKSNKNVFHVVPKETTATGGCTEDKANLTLTFKQGYITFLFNKNKTSNVVEVDTVSFSLNYPLGEGKFAELYSKFSGWNGTLHLFHAAVGHSYSCKNDTLDVGEGLILEVTQNRVQAFNLTTANDFGTPEQCAADRPNYTVAIAVGVTLLVLIVIVIIVYLIGRRKRSSGYQSL